MFQSPVCPPPPSLKTLTRPCVVCDVLSAHPPWPEYSVNISPARKTPRIKDQCRIMWGPLGTGKMRLRNLLVQFWIKCSKFRQPWIGFLSWLDLLRILGFKHTSLMVRRAALSKLYKFLMSKGAPEQKKRKIWKNENINIQNK